MIEHPWFLILLLPFILYFKYRNTTKFYFRHPHTTHLKNKIARNVQWQHLIFAGIIFLILAASSIVWRNSESTKTYLVHKYVLVNDGSGSMIDGRKENGIGVELTAVLSGNDKLLNFLGKRKDGSRDLVGAIVFSSDAFTVSNLSDDPFFVQKKLKRIDYRLPPLSSGTDIEAGLWAALEMLLSQDNMILEENLEHLQIKFYGSEHEVKKDEVLEDIIAKKNVFSGSSIIIFTDGIFEPRGSKTKMSSYKIINFCKALGIRVYFISIFSLDATIIKYSKDTGGRGEVIKSGYDKKRLEEIYEDIVTSQANEYVVKEQVVDHSLSGILGLLGLASVVLGLVWRSFRINFTEV